MKTSIFLLFLIVTAYISCNDQTCKWSQDGTNYDFNYLTKTNGNYVYSDTDEGIDFIWNICKPWNNDGTCDCCKNATMTAWTKYTDGTCKYWGDYNNGNTYSYIDNTNPDIGVKISNQILTSLGHTIRSAAFHLFCNPSEVHSVISAYQHQSMPSHVQLNIETYKACQSYVTPTPTPTADPTVCMTIQDNELYDLRPVKGSYKYTDKSTGNKYWLSVCKNLDDVSDCSCCDPHVTTGYLVQNDKCTELGDLATSNWRPIDPDDAETGVTLEYDKINSAQKKVRSMKWDFVCDIGTKGEITEIDELSLLPPRTEITFTTKYACPESPFAPSPSPTATATVTSKSNGDSTTGGLNGGYTFLVTIVCGGAFFFIGWIVHKYRIDRKQGGYSNL
ncbi:hypothetical protein M0813_20265 [Anaeramoeba flamelloides]|uniref:MRH domain-containing protein n=1 Tax=Anaeramoeba flamelloides TaxID=1746091 RepID=A0ABQ8YL68_9EUKA|nr:hypothetical protein M0813_20265 [Anaeramoeba flamelloides]